MKQQVNRLVMLRTRGLSGPLFQNIGGGRLMHTSGAHIAVGGLPIPDKLCPGNVTGEGAWGSGETYGPCRVVSHQGRYFVASSGHTAATTTEPGVGVNWESVWVEVKLYSPSQTVAPQPSSLSGSVTEGATTPALVPLKVQAVDSNGAAIPWSVSEQTGSAWLSVAKSSGFGPMDSVEVSIDPSGLTDGVYTDALVFTAPSETPIVVPVTLTVQPAGVFVALESGDGIVLTEDDNFVATEMSS